MTALLPIRFPPAPGEAVTSYAARLAGANGLTTATLWTRPLCSQPTIREVTRLATAAGITAADVRAATPFHYPVAVTGTKAKQSGGWLLNTPPWVCPTCTPTTGITHRDWVLALHPVCPTCGVLLTREVHDEPTAAPEPLLTLTADLVALADAAITNRPARARLRRLRRLCTLVSQTLDDHWPPPTSDDDAAVRAVAVVTPWGGRPDSHPTAVAAVLLAVQHAWRSPTREQALIAEGWERLRSRPVEVTHGAPSHFPKRPAVRTPTRATANPATVRWTPDVFTREDADRLTWVRRKVDQLRRTHRLGARHVPALLFLPGEDPLPPGALWRDRAEAAIALHMLLDTHPSGRVGSAAAASHAFGTARTEASRLVDGITFDTGLADADATLLLTAADHLIAEQLVDYQHRRDVLRPHDPTLNVLLRRLPARPAAVYRSPADLAYGWIWVHHTRGPLYTSALTDLPTSTVL
ncbi:MAG: hypothetical protein EOL91_05525, partial [Actinobacteria bacterium]|nr:hypothetical protein [Actinomycetota bacterium]